ncbi:hypothetical protein ZOSMA_47G00570 [Zostera marina]|uniref:Pentatricopeptide repeat-containing protein n=1 Tax=Zostera marina TaxID=29655 RepID=A0A0K9NZW9_ZOSMR|nr:hypothetical protein ZOSMA_47G00570 [Zostera marina]
MIMAYGSHGQASTDVELFNNMKKTNEKPDHITFLDVLFACAHGGLNDEGHSVTILIDAAAAN